MKNNTYLRFNKKIIFFIFCLCFALIFRERFEKSPFYRSKGFLFHVLQYTNKLSLIADHEEHIQSVRNWSVMYNHSYKLIYGTEKDGYFEKIKSISNYFSSIPLNDWVVFLDLDIKVCDFERANLSSLDSKQCSVLAQDSNHTANTGFLIIKNNAFGREFIKLWISQYKTCRWLRNQGPFTNVILEKAFNSRGKVYRNQCCTRKMSHHRKNICYKDALNSLGYKLNDRKIGSICLIPDSNRWNMHDSGQNYKRGDAFYHTHGIGKC